jgi:pSer/pThr/pTyr-binding forkhead associated (FHA) protein
MREPPNLTGMVFPLNLSSPTTIGRGSDADIPIPELSITRYHARITPSGGGFVIEDLNSRNGTFINGKRIEGDIALNEGDIVRMGSVVAAFER